MTTGGEVLVQSLVAHGVTAVFGIPGTHNLEIYRHLTRYGIRHVTTRHEQGAGYAADGYARTSGRPGVVVTTTGPAVLNAAAALAQAYSDSVPVLLVAPGPPVRHPQRGRGMLHEMRDQRGAMAGVATAHRVHSHAEITQAVAQAFAEMGCGRPRPAYLEIPLDLLNDSAAEISIVEPLEVAPQEPAAALVEIAARRLAAADTPGLLLGGGAKHAAAEAREVAEALGAAVLTTVNGKGILAEDHPLAVGAALHLPAASRFVEECDVLLAVGTEFAETDWWSGVPRPRFLVRIDADLPQLLTNATPDLAIHADARCALRALAAALGQAPMGADRARAAEWRQRLRAEARTEGARWVSTMEAIASVLDRDAAVTADNAMASYYGAVGNLPIHTPGGFCFPTGFGTLGYALPAALGAAVADPNRPVVALVGDGGLMFTVQELATVAAEGIPLPVVVFVNGGYGEIRAQMHAAGIEPLGVDLPSPDWVLLARALGGEGVVCQSPGMLADELRAALSRRGPTLLVVAEHTAP